VDNVNGGSEIVPSLRGMPSVPVPVAGVTTRVTTASTSVVPRIPPIPDSLLVDLAGLGARVDAVVEDLTRRGRAARVGFDAVLWDASARAALDARLDRLDEELAGLVAELRECGVSVREPGRP